jgi:Fanconi anemia group D2 protein
LPKVEVYDKLEPLSQKEKELLCDKLFFTLNWFREVVNAFATQSDPEMKAKVITRLHNVTELQGYLLLFYISVTVGFSTMRITHTLK